jgi:Transcriptional Coactivator p15 (PC4)
LTATADFTEEATAAVIELNAKTQVRFRLQTWKNTRRLDIRIFNLYAKSGEWGPTSRGVSVPVKHTEELLAAVTALVEAARLEQQS